MLQQPTAILEEYYFRGGDGVVPAGFAVASFFFVAASLTSRPVTGTAVGGCVLLGGGDFLVLPAFR